MLLLTIALIVDGLINIARIVEVERGMKLQARWLSNRDKELMEIVAALTKDAAPMPAAPRPEEEEK